MSGVSGKRYDTDSGKSSVARAGLFHALRDGKLESEIMPLDETLSIMKTLDQLRRHWGLKYPME